MGLAGPVRTPAPHEVSAVQARSPLQPDSSLPVPAGQHHTSPGLNLEPPAVSCVSLKRIMTAGSASDAN